MSTPGPSASTSDPSTPAPASLAPERPDASSDQTSDVVVVGGGIVGLATAWRLSEARPDLRITVLEKDETLAAHQTGRNSGVVHSGIYYKPGSLKATLCHEGRLALAEFVAEHDVAYDRCGKIIVATTEAEQSRLAGLLERGQANDVTCSRIDADTMRAREPHVTGIEAILVEDAGIVDYPGMCERMAEGLRARGHAVITGAKVVRVESRGGEHRVVAADGRTWPTRLLVTCGGLHADRLARMAGARPTVRIVPFRGEYHILRPEAEHLCRHLIYPVPDPALPFLGVHLTRMVEGGVECGPNAVLALAREGYFHSTVSPRDLAEMICFPGFRRLILRHWRTGIDEYRRSLSRRRLVASLRTLVPEIQVEDLRVAPAGVRAQAVSPDGAMVDDFVIEEVEGAVHVLNAPSPAATASLAIGRHIAEIVSGRLPQTVSSAV